MKSAAPEFWPNVDDFDAIILGLGGVITRTDSLHKEAWTLVLKDFFQNQKDLTDQAYSTDLYDSDYEDFLAGRPCEKGIQDLLAARGIQIPKGHYEDDSAQKSTAWALGNKKDRIFRELLEDKGASLYEDTFEQIKVWRSRGIKIGVVSFSRECVRVLKTTGIYPFLDAVVDGRLASRLQLNGKPDPDALLHACWILNVDPSRCAVLDDSPGALQAAKAGGVGLSIGIDRVRRPEILVKAGADIVIPSVGELSFVKGTQPERRQWHRPPSALKCFNQIQQRFRTMRVAFFFDFDGTLTPIVKHPEQAKLSFEMKNLLQEISLLSPVTIVSGRDRLDLERSVGISDLFYIGSHGYDIRGPQNIRYEHPDGQVALPDLEKAKKELSEVLKDIPGVFLEAKKFALAIHYRNVEAKYISQIEPFIDHFLSTTVTLKKTYGKKTIELRPKFDWDKGKGARWLMEQMGFLDDNIFPVFIGDDLTDEDGFRAFEKDGLGIFVGTPEWKTSAQYSLNDVDEVKIFLNRILGNEQRDLERSGWVFSYNQFEPKQELLREALCTLGNGYFATRGAAEERDAEEDCHYPGTYLAGGYNRLTTKISGRDIVNEDLVNWPNWLPLSFRHEGESNWFDLRKGTLKEFRQDLDLREGILERVILFQDPQGRITELHSRRLVHMGDHHLAALQWKITPQNWSGKIEVRSALDGRVINSGVKRYRELNSQHLDALETWKQDHTIALRVRTTQSRVEMVQAARLKVFKNMEETHLSPKIECREDYVSQLVSIPCEEGQTLQLEKTVSLFTSKDAGISEAGCEAIKSVTEADDFDGLLKSHARAWWRLWNRCDITIDGSQSVQNILRLHIFHLLQTASVHTTDLDAGIPARGWHGEAYRGHIFWDEIYIFPFLNMRIPMITRSLLMYRYRRLHEARLNAKSHGYKGAMYPWQSGSSGKEETQVLHLNPNSGKWVPDNTHRQVHINIAIVYNVFAYFQATADIHFLSHYGAKMILEIARFFSSIATFNSEKDRFEIKGVVGPDEYHTQYPDTDKPGLDNNAYTNIMTAWLVTRASEVLEILPQKRALELRRGLGINDRELARWEAISKKMFVPFHDDNIISQFEGYENLEEFDWQEARRKWGNIQRLDRLLGAEGDSTNRYKLAKQCDVLMLFYLLSPERLIQVFDRLGYSIDQEMILKNIDYYQKRTSHGSTLSRIVHSWVLARADRETSWKYFIEALKSDVEDIQGGTTPEGIHLGAMAGTVDLIQRGDLGMAIRDDVLWFDPCLPEQLSQLKLRIQYRGRWLAIQVTSNYLRVTMEEGGAGPVKIGFRGEVLSIAQKGTQVWKL